MRIEEVFTQQLNPADENHNRMTTAEFEHLKRSIDKFGFVQPVLVDDDGERLTIVDGHHRVSAAKELGLEKVLAVIREGGDDPRIVAVALNRIRGQLDLTGVAVLTSELVLEDGFDLDDLTVMGFSDDELRDLLTATQNSESVTDELGAASGEVEEERVPKPFLLEITFRTRGELQKAKRAIKKAAGKGGDLSTGLLRLAGVEE